MGEASNYFAQGEVETVIATIANRRNINRIYAAQNAGYFPFIGGTSVLGILSADYDAHRSRSGERKLNQAKAQNGGVLPTGYVCDQLLAAKAWARQFGDFDDADAAFEVFPYVWNLGSGVALPANAFGVIQIGNTRFFNRPFR